MNRTRINQLLGVLLFPYLDTRLQKKDYLLERYEAYEAYISQQGNSIANIDEKLRKSSAYKEKTDELISYLASRSRAGVKSYDDILMLCELYYPFYKIEEIPYEVSPQHKVSWLYLKRLKDMACSLLTYRDGVIALRNWNNEGEEDIFMSQDIFDKIQIWNMLICCMIPDILIVIFAMECGWDETALYGQKPHISLADKLLMKSFRKGIVENHIHFNAGYDYEMIWLNTVNLFTFCSRRKERLDEKQEDLFAAAVFRMTAARYLVSGIRKQAEFQKWVNRLECRDVLNVVKSLYSGEIIDCERESIIQWLEDCIPAAEKYAEDYLLHVVYDNYTELKTSSEFLLLFQCYRYIRQSQDSFFLRIFLQYLRIKNNFFQDIQQSILIPGLKYFQKYFSRAKAAETESAGVEGMAMDVFRTQVRLEYLKKIEIRIAPAVDFSRWDNITERGKKKSVKYALYKQLKQIFLLYRNSILECIIGVRDTAKLAEEEAKKVLEKSFSYHQFQQEICRSQKEKIDALQVPVMGIVYHLIKTENLDNLSGYHCPKRLQSFGTENNCHRLILREAMRYVTEVIEEIRSEIPSINEYIVGIDAASDENAMEPWMFAPAYNGMRSKGVTKPVAHTEIMCEEPCYAIQNVGFTYHVGEDYRHIVSGLRHIDEVIEEFHYKPGDRLGHAIALGTDIDRWLEANGTIAIPVKEHLENLLWIWGKNVYDGLLLPMQLEELEVKILENAQTIYGYMEGITIPVLYQAYKEKFKADHREVIDELNHDGEERISNKTGYCKYPSVSCGKHLGLWSKEKLIYTNYCPVFEERGSRVKLVTVTESETETYKVLQEYLLRKIEQRGIYVEVNPTSNVTIGDFDDLVDHPIFRMNSLDSDAQGRHHVMVTVNSDDPAVFNTNVENELAYIYYAVQHGGYAKSEVLKWIDEIRQNGLDGSFIQKIKSTDVLLEEISGILDALKRVELWGERWI